jgi:hypothetical protein
MLQASGVHTSGDATYRWDASGYVEDAFIRDQVYVRVHEQGTEHKALMVLKASDFPTGDQEKIIHIVNKLGAFLAGWQDREDAAEFDAVLPTFVVD